jgi:hypothetical protein
VIYRIIKQLEACSVAWMVQPTRPTVVIPSGCSLVSLVSLVLRVRDGDSVRNFPRAVLRIVVVLQKAVHVPEIFS